MIKLEENLNQKAIETYHHLVETKVIPSWIEDLKEELSAQELTHIRQSLELKENQLIEASEQAQTTEERKIIRKQKSEVHRQHKQLDDFAQGKARYEEQKVIMGVRNSFSKTAHTATFMRMKEDHMRNGN